MNQPDLTNIERLIRTIPYARYLGIKALARGAELLFVLPSDERFLGNPIRPAVHGGVVGAFLEQAASLHLMAVSESNTVPETIDFSVDFLRPTRMADIYAQCLVTRRGTMIANVSIKAWQEDRYVPRALAGHTF